MPGENSQGRESKARLLGVRRWLWGGKGGREGEEESIDGDGATGLLGMLPVSVSMEMLNMEGSEETMFRDILRQSLNGSSSRWSPPPPPPPPGVTAPLTCRGREREVPISASTRDERNSISDGGTTNT